MLAGGTSAEELVEGLAIGTGVVIEPEVGALIAAAIAVDNFSEGLSIGELVAGRSGGEREGDRARSLGGRASSARAYWSRPYSAGCSSVKPADPSSDCCRPRARAGCCYLTVSALVPPSEERQYQGSGALATGAGFLVILFLAESI